jgi:ribosome-associated protein
MAKRRTYETDVLPGDEEELPSRTEKRAIRKGVQSDLDALTKRLVALTPRMLASLELDESMIEAVRHLATMSKGPAMARQRRLVARMLRGYDVRAVTRRLDIALGDTRLDARTHRLETWRARLLDGGDAALDALLREHPGAARQRLRQAVRAAIAERAEGKTAKRQRELYQLLKELGEPASEQAPPEPATDE